MELQRHMGLKETMTWFHVPGGEGKGGNRLAGC